MKKNSHSWTGEVWGGLASMLVALPSAVAFGILVYTTLGPEYAGQGAMAGLLGATALGLISPFIGKTTGLISTPCAPAAAVLSADSNDDPFLRRFTDFLWKHRWRATN